MHTNSSSSDLPSVLVIAGFDPSGGAGVLSDAKTIHANGGYACSVISAITVQNTQGVQQVQPVAPQQFAAQLHALLEDIQFDVIKIGMLASIEQVQILSQLLSDYATLPCVLDPVFMSSSGHLLLPENAVSALIDDLIPRTTLLTPNQNEATFLLAERHRPVRAAHARPFSHELSGNKPPKNLEKPLSALKCANVLLKGGHAVHKKDAPKLATDWLFSWTNAGFQLQEYSTPWLEVQHSHGTGCTLASAIATYLAKGETLEHSVRCGKRYLTQALKNADQYQPKFQPLPAGQQRHGSLCHFFEHLH